MGTPQEPDFPPGHPGRHDYDPNTPEAKEWARKNVSLKGERDWPRGNIKASDTEGNQNSVRIEPGVDPNHPEKEAFTGRTPEQVEAVRKYHEELAPQVKETAPREPTIAPAPPKPGDISEPTGQPSEPAPKKWGT